MSSWNNFTELEESIYKMILSITDPTSCAEEFLVWFNRWQAGCAVVEGVPHECGAPGGLQQQWLRG